METEAVIDGIADLGQPVPVPQGAPWYPDDVEVWSVRWVLLHLIDGRVTQGTQTSFGKSWMAPPPSP